MCSLIILTNYCTHQDLQVAIYDLCHILCTPSLLHAVIGYFLQVCSFYLSILQHNVCWLYFKVCPNCFVPVGFCNQLSVVNRLQTLYKLFLFCIGLILILNKIFLFVFGTPPIYLSVFGHCF